MKKKKEKINWSADFLETHKFQNLNFLHLFVASICSSPQRNTFPQSNFNYFYISPK